MIQTGPGLSSVQQSIIQSAPVNSCHGNKLHRSCWSKKRCGHYPLLISRSSYQGSALVMSLLWPAHVSWASLSGASLVRCMCGEQCVQKEKTNIFSQLLSGNCNNIKVLPEFLERVNIRNGYKLNTRSPTAATMFSEVIVTVDTWWRLFSYQVLIYSVVFVFWVESALKLGGKIYFSLPLVYVYTFQMLGIPYIYVLGPVAHLKKDLRASAALLPSIFH